MNEPFLYNPCVDGLAAKAWECLRRNKNFTAISHIDAKNEEEAMHEFAAIYDDLPSNPFIRNALVYYLGHDPEDSIVFPDYNFFPHTITHKNWSNLPTEFKSRLNASLIPYLPEFFKISPPLNHKIERGESGLGNEYGSILNFLHEVYYTTETNNLVSLPKFVWDKRHKQNILKKISELLGPPKGKTQRLKPTGSTLGSYRDWESFLLYEFWVGLGFDRKQAIDLAAREYHDKPKLLLRHHPNAKAKSEANKRLKQQKPSNDCSTLRKSIENIEHYIDNIFPDLNLSPIHK
jgi:hypothetical protein